MKMVLFSILIQDEKDFDFDKEVFRHYKRMIGMVRNSNVKLVINNLPRYITVSKNRRMNPGVESLAQSLTSKLHIRTI